MWADPVAMLFVGCIVGVFTTTVGFIILVNFVYYRCRGESDETVP